MTTATERPAISPQTQRQTEISAMTQDTLHHQNDPVAWSTLHEALVRPGTWKNAWDLGLTPWDHAASTPALRSLLASPEYPELTKGKILVPGCGGGYDVHLFAQSPGCEYALGLDLSPVAMQKAEKLRDEKSISPQKAQFLAGDFFVHPFGTKFDVVYDHTFLCALQPTLRKDWGKRMAEIIAPGGHLITYMYPLSDHEGGPPFALSVEVYDSLLSTEFEKLFMEDVLETFESRTRQEYGEKLAVWKRK
ncbi:TPMT family [Fimicolochytrium jonesii]|uniref:TPMT family n=1 Tax=Fimicolochytrium jonesii TaxID=1396493 RepID=UPI0022FF1EB7|nr:TPMT family [Fimicolochytrium jonesii]KAI8818705.1 TPMT family [Fimicolochytrium jonesii]